MEANMISPPTITTEINRSQGGQSQVRTPQAPRQQAPAPATEGMNIDISSIAPNRELLEAHSRMNFQLAEEMGTISIPYSPNEIAESTIQRAVDYTNEALAPTFFRLDMSVHDATNLVMVSVMDTNTEEVLREIPPECRLDLLAKLQEASGIVIDVKG
jgi:flagellar protein FlaG